MSQYRLEKIKVKVKNPQKAREAILKRREQVISMLKSLGLEDVEIIENGVVKTWSSEEMVDILIRTELSYGNGFGLRFTKEGVEVVYDAHAARERDVGRIVEALTETILTVDSIEDALSDLSIELASENIAIQNIEETIRLEDGRVVGSIRADIFKATPEGLRHLGEMKTTIKDRKRETAFDGPLGRVHDVIMERLDEKIKDTVETTETLEHHYTAEYDAVLEEEREHDLL